ncbi:hypothetical protein EQ500_04515, partial [Lactobacillus sp. XV13L]|nr:hypothetical protein [Lactobacillus sp. XV13L]
TLRNRLRNQVIPLLKSENPRLQQHWTVFAQQNQVLQQITQNYFQQLSQQAVIVSAKTVKINLSSLTHLSSQAVVLFVQSVLHRHLELDLQARQLEQLEQLLNRAQGQLTLAHKWILEKSYQLLIIQQFDHSLQKVSAINLKLNQTVFANQQQKITIKQSVRENNHTFYFEHLPRQIIVRPRRPGDRIRLLNGQHQKLKQRLIDLKIPQKQRNQLWLVVFDGEIVWVPGVYRYQIYPTPYLFEIIIGEQK